MTEAGRTSASWRLTACEAARAVAERRITCVELMRAALSRCVELEPRVRAWEILDADRAMGAAEAADARLRSGAAARLLEGLPLGVKDIVDVAGLPTRMGSPLTADSAAARSADCVARLQAAGAIAIGKTVTTEFAYYAPGKTRNPWNAGHTPGGSSSGSAAAVACGMVAGALGTQTNGSIVRPAAFCGIVGYKPTLGAIANDGTLDPWPTLDHTGVLARTVADAALFASVAAKDDVRIPAEIAAVKVPRLAAVRSPVWHLAEPAGQASFERAIARLRAAGADILERELPPSFEQAHTAMRTLMACEARRYFGRLRDERGDGMSGQLRALIDEGAAIPDQDYRDALALRRELQQSFAAYIAPFDALITPSAPGVAPATLDQTGSPAFCSIWSLLGVPAITVPIELAAPGLPLGLQLVAAHGEDAAVLAAAAWCERQFAFPFLHRTERS